MDPESFEMIQAQQIFINIPCIKSFPQVPRQTPFHERPRRTILSPFKLNTIKRIFNIKWIKWTTKNAHKAGRGLGYMHNTGHSMRIAEYEKTKKKMTSNYFYDQKNHDWLPVKLGCCKLRSPPHEEGVGAPLTDPGSGRGGSPGTSQEGSVRKGGPHSSPD